MKIIFRVDSSKDIGIGHISRCLKLANSFKNKKIYFVTKKLEGSANFLLNKNFKILFIESKNEKDDAKKFLKILKYKIKFDNTKDFVIMDNYSLENTWEKIIKKNSIKLITIDDRIRSSKADYYINSNWFFQKNSKFSNFRYQNLLLGPLYSLLNLKKNKRSKKFIVIYFGSNDKYNLTCRSLLNLIKIKEKKILIILGHNYKFRKTLVDIINNNKDIKIIDKYQSLENIFSEAKFFIGAGGSISNERLFYKIPSMICPVVKNQNLISKLLHEQKLQILLKKNDFFNFNKWKNEFIKLKNNRIILTDRMNFLSIDKSLPRVLNLFSRGNLPFKLIKFRNKDKNIIYNFINQPDAIYSRFSNRYIGINEHNKFFSNLETATSERLFLGIYNQIISGFIRFSFVKKDLALIDIYCCPTVRGKNFSKKMLLNGIKNILRTNKNAKFIAKVKKNNIKSLNFFKKYFKDLSLKNNTYEFKYKN